MNRGSRRPLIMMIADRWRLAERLGQQIDAPALTDAVLSHIAAAADAGVDLIQIREPLLEGRAAVRLVRSAVSAVTGSAARIIVNDRLDVAMAAAADGVHLPSQGLPPDRVRALLPRPAMVGLSVHDPVPDLPVTPLDYLVFGTVYPTRSKSPGHSVAGPSGLRAAVASTALPVLAIGGVTAARIPEIAATGASGIAGIDLFLPDSGTTSGTQLRKIVEFVHQVFDSARGVS
jgi:thiamine-phosphate pyrophosphorylase